MTTHTKEEKQELEIVLKHLNLTEEQFDVMLDAAVIKMRNNKKLSFDTTKKLTSL
jgi:hypothetical protein